MRITTATDINLDQIAIDYFGEGGLTRGLTKEMRVINQKF